MLGDRSGGYLLNGPVSTGHSLHITVPVTIALSDGSLPVIMNFFNGDTDTNFGDGVQMEPSPSSRMDLFQR